MMHYTRMVLGYHGCDALVAEQVLQGATTLRSSENAYDWLGHGIYFWEHGPDRALRWAREQCERDKLRPPRHRAAMSAPAVLGAFLQLGRCFDLLDTASTDALTQWTPRFRALLRKNGQRFPGNRGALLHDGDCAVLNAYLVSQAREGHSYDTVRSCFLEGQPLYRGSGIRRKAHIQVAVRNPACIIGVFRPTLGARS